MATELEQAQRETAEAPPAALEVCVRDVSHAYPGGGRARASRGGGSRADGSGAGGSGGGGSGAGDVRPVGSGAGGVRALEGVSLSAARGEVLAVVGPSGCGKTTLLELMCGLQAPQQGAVECAPAVLMPQRDLLLPWLSALDNAALALRIAGQPRRRARAQAGALFAQLGLQGFQDARPQQLSGGMRQRVAFLRTLLSGKPVLCLDEPFGALDAITRAEMQEWLAGALRRQARTVVLVTHDVEEAIVLADRVAVLSSRPGQVLAQLPVPLPRPRARTDREVIALREQALQLLGAGVAGIAQHAGAPREGAGAARDGRCAPPDASVRRGGEQGVDGRLGGEGNRAQQSHGGWG